MRKQFLSILLDPSMLLMVNGCQEKAVGRCWAFLAIATIVLSSGRAYQKMKPRPCLSAVINVMMNTTGVRVEVSLDE